MPKLIEHIDAIARRKQRDVLFIVFKSPGIDPNSYLFPDDLDWKNLTARAEIIQWLDMNGIPWQPCGAFANPNYVISYRGQIYIDLPFDRAIPAYTELERFLEKPDGSMRFPEATFAYLPLVDAMKNTEHDEPGYWDRWVEKFLN